MVVYLSDAVVVFVCLAKKRCNTHVVETKGCNKRHAMRVLQTNVMQLKCLRHSKNRWGQVHWSVDEHVEVDDMGHEEAEVRRRAVVAGHEAVEGSADVCRSQVPALLASAPLE